MVTKEELDREFGNESDEELINKYKEWPFKSDDWLINFIFSQAEILYSILTIKNYKYNTLSGIVLELYSRIEKIREKLEEQDSMFQKKKAYLLQAEKDGNKSIQIPLEGEYSLKKYVTLYKIYEFIGWFSKLRKESTIFKICILEKQKLIEKMVPLADLSIRKVIGAKVVPINHDQFEDTVSNAWVAIINFLPKVDPARVMFSLFVSIANNSAYFYKARLLKHIYNTVQMSVLEDKMNQSDDIDGEFFISSVNNKNEGITASSLEDEVLDRIDMEKEFDLDDSSALYKAVDIDIEDIINQTTQDTEETLYNKLSNQTRSSAIEQRILSYSFTILSGKVRKLCYQKIYAEFFIDLIEQRISKKVVSKYANLFLNVINFDELSAMNSDNPEVNDALIRMLKTWIKSKQEYKLKTNVNKENKFDEKIEREQKVYEYIRDNKNALEELLKFRKDCLIFKIGEEEK